MKKVHKFTYTIAAFFFALVFLIFSLWGGGVGSAYAATSTTVASFDKTEVLEDLQTATIDGKKFNILDYPFDSTGVFKHPEILTVVEYCYSIRPAQRDNFGLYVYFYNPQALNISTTSKANKITLGIKYSEDKDGFTKVDDYEKFDLQFCSKSSGDYRDLFYKFKVIDHKSAVDGLTIEQRVNSNERRYDISEVELLTYGNINATAYTVGGTYKFTGYAAGYGADLNAESTLAMSFADNLETVELDIAGIKDGIDKRTYWRSNSSSLGAHHQNQINSVFFAIDTSVLEKFGYTLQKIKAEWWEYKTAPAVVIDNKGIYDRLVDYCGVKISEDYDKTRGLSMNNSDYTVVNLAGGGANSYYSWTWNKELGVFNSGAEKSDFVETLLPLLFYTDGIKFSSYVLTVEKLQSYCETYDNSYEKGHLKINEHDFSADLFADKVDEGRTRGYNLREFDITNPDDYWDIRSYDSTHNWWQKFKDYGFGTITTNDDYSDISPIQMLKAEDFAVSNVGDHLKINKNDVSKLRDYYNSSVADKNGDGKPDNAVFLFRYAQTDYWSEGINIYDIVNDKSYKKLRYDSTQIAFACQGTQFFDFDILTMTFNKMGELSTLGVASSPVDHWSDYTPPIEPKNPDWWKWVKLVLGIIAAILLIVLLFPILSPILGFIFKGLLWLITAPFKALGKLFKKKE